MLRDADASLANWLAGVLPPGTGVRFDAPHPGWEGAAAAAPFVSLFLHGVRRHGGELPAAGWTQVRDSGGRLLGRQSAARYYQASYVVTAWAAAAGPESGASAQALEEHGLLGLLLLACTDADTLAEDHLTGALAEAGRPSFVRCADEPERTAQGLWPGLGIAPRAHLVLELVAPVVPPMVTELAPPAREIALGASRLPATPAAPDGQPGTVHPGTARRWERSSVTEPTRRPVRP